MQLQIQVNDNRAETLFNFLEIFKKENMIRDYQVIDSLDDYDKQVLEDLQEFGTALKNAEQGIGRKTGKIIQLDSRT